MKAGTWILCLAFCTTLLGVAPVRAADRPNVAANDVVWTTPGQNENDSMPIGNGDLAANVWTEHNGDLVLLVSKSDAWTEMGKLVKLGRVRIQLTPNPFANAADFKQILRLEDGSIQIRSGENTLLVWADANHPVIHVDADLSKPATLKAGLEVWRRSTHSYNEPSPEKGGMFEFGNHPVPLDFEADTVMPAAGNRLEWYHYNQASLYPLVMKQEHLEQFASKYADPLLHRCFGATIFGPGLVSRDDRTLESGEARRKLGLDLVALTTADSASPEAWEASLNSLVNQVKAISINGARAASRRWWQEFWDRSWIEVSGTPEAEKVSQGYMMQRYMLAASSRGAYPTKYNGGLFTVGHDMPADRESNYGDHNPDFRAWGNSYWNQNNRLLYWPLIATGDFDLLKPWFNMYLNALPLAKDRTEAYYHHPGAFFIETMYFWGVPNLNDFGWDNATDVVESRYMRYHTQGALEVIAQMLDEYDITEDAEFARQDVVPFADAILTYYDRHWQRGADGKILFSPTQSIETYQLDAVNPTPDIAGLKAVVPRMLALPRALTTEQQREQWSKLLADLPAIATGRTENGKIPRNGVSDPDGKEIILPAEKFGPTRNVENPSLYVAFPYEIYGVGKPDLEIARNTYAARLFPQDTCWGQDGPQAAVLGLTAEAKKAAIDEFTFYGNQRFKWFWRPGHDWIPDLDDGGTGMMTLQLMLMQTDGKRIQLLPAWPSDWSADFKLHAPGRTTIEGRVEHGKIARLVVMPKSREKDVVVVGAEDKQ